MTENQSPNKRVWVVTVSRVLDTIATLVLVAVCAGVLLRTNSAQGEPAVKTARPGQASARQRDQTLPLTPLSIGNAGLIGQPTAKWMLIVYSDFQCPFCASFARDVLPTLVEKFVKTSEIAIGFKHFPLGKHTAAQIAAQAAECSRREGKFPQMLVSLFKEPNLLSREKVIGYGTELGLDQRNFTKCLDHDSADVVAEDVKVADRLGVSGTPSFFFGRTTGDGKVEVTQRFEGAKTLTYFNNIITLSLRTDKTASSKSPLR
jgi:protein-disulfide isomerase